MNDTDYWALCFDCETYTKDFGFQNAANQHIIDIGYWAPKISCERYNKKFFT